jgi:SMODS and SLOG-associating 2TM effector domain family 5
MSSDPLDKLLAAMKTTAGSRFNPAQYLENNDRNLTWVTAITSVYIIAITVVPSFWKLPIGVTENLNLVTMVFSIIILVSVLLHNSRRDAVNAEQHHRSALEISELRRELLTHGSDLESEVFISFSSRYGAILQKYSINHSPLDYHNFMADRPDQFPWMGSISRFRIKVDVYS